MDLYALECRQDRHIERQLSGSFKRRLPASERPPDTVRPRMREILAALAELRFASVETLMIYTGHSERNVQRYVAGLRDRKLVGWFLWSGRKAREGALRGPTPKPVYCLTTKGAERCILDRVVQDDKYLLTRSWRGKSIVMSTMPHQLGLVDIMVGLRIAARRSPFYGIDWMVPDFVYEDLDGKSRVATIELLGTDNEVRADLIACARAKNSTRMVNFYIELERKNKGAQIITKKFKNYSALFRAKERRFNDGSPVLLYIVSPCDDARDTKKRMDLVRSWVAGKPVEPAFRIASLDKVKENSFGPIWQKADGSEWRIGE